MNWDEYAREFRQKALLDGRTEEFIARALAYAEPLNRAGLPVLYDARTISLALGFDPPALMQLLNHPRQLYISFRIAKRSGGQRSIDQPVPALMEIQRWILESILEKVPLHPAATAFTTGSSIVQNATPHSNKQMVLSLDIKDFFLSIQRTVVAAIFRGFGYRPKAAYFLTRLVTFRGSLPQGAPTSPYLSNLAMRTFDADMSAAASSSDLSYTRYADDITISGHFHPGLVISRVRRRLSVLGLSLNDAKTRLMLPHERQEVTGVIVNNVKLRTPRQVRRGLRTENYYISKFGIDAHEARRGSLLANRADHLRGLAEYVRFVDPDDKYAAKTIDLLGRVRFAASENGPP